MQFIKAALTFSITFGVVYLLGVFVTTDFNIGNWEPEGRFLVAVTGGLVGLCSIPAVLEEGF